MCPKQCAACSLSEASKKLECSKCIDDTFELKESQCVSKCGESTFLTKDGSCKPCDSSCRKCSSELATDC